MSEKFLKNFCDQNFNTQPDQWDKSLLRELKLPEVGNKNIKKSLDSGSWPVLSLESHENKHLPTPSVWKKASQTYILPNENLASELEEDLKGNVLSFFFEKSSLDLKSWTLVQKILSKASKPQEIEVILLGEGHFEHKKAPFALIDESSLHTGRKVHDLGGSIVQELGLLAVSLTQGLADSETLDLGVFVGPQFFKNMAKIRAAKLLAYKVLEVMNSSKKVRVIALTSYRDWTLYERYSNLLRNDAAVASAYIGGADIVQTSGYENIFELEFGANLSFEHRDRSRRMARNTSHILALESMLGSVEDAAFGSFHLENLTEHYATMAWSYMQRMLKLESDERETVLTEEVRAVKEERLKLMRTRKHVLAGVNDFPDVQEVLNLKSLPRGSCFRVSQEFEALRMKMELVKSKPEVCIGFFGDSGILHARLNFVKNYFEILGLKVKVMNLEDVPSSNDIFVLCAADADYEKCSNSLSALKSKQNFVATGIEISGFVGLYAGQNVYSILEKIVSEWESR